MEYIKYVKFNQEKKRNKKIKEKEANYNRKNIQLLNI